MRDTVNSFVVNGEFSVYIVWDLYKLHNYSFWKLLLHILNAISILGFIYQLEMRRTIIVIKENTNRL